MTARNLYDFPADVAITNKDGSMPVPWGLWFQRTHKAALSIQQSGPTTDRPTVGAWIGFRFYDTTLNKPVYVSAVKPYVWRDAMANIV